MSRSSEYRKAVADKICDDLAAGKSLRKICMAKTMPSFQTVLKWARDNAEFRAAYAFAREAQVEYMLCEILDIADSKGKNLCLRIDTRKWLIPRLAPKKYGDKIAAELSGPGGGPVKIDITDMDRAKALAALMGKLKAKTAAKTG